jgi:hypothetical protein
MMMISGLQTTETNPKTKTLPKTGKQDKGEMYIVDYQ